MKDSDFVSIYAVCSMKPFDTAYLCDNGVTPYCMYAVGEEIHPSHYLTVLSWPGFCHGNIDSLLSILRPFSVMSYVWLTYYIKER